MQDEHAPRSKNLAGFALWRVSAHTIDVLAGFEQYRKCESRPLIRISRATMDIEIA
jgi:hypothetical protein